jgi:hypothetical protein
LLRHQFLPFPHGATASGVPGDLSL